MTQHKICQIPVFRFRTNTNTDTNDNSNNQYSQDDLNDLFRYFFGNRGYGYGG